MVSGLLWLRFIGKGGGGAGNVMESFKSDKHMDSALILELELKWFKSH